MLSTLVKTSTKFVLLAVATTGAAVAVALLWIPGRGFADSASSAHRVNATPDARLQTLEEAVRSSGIQQALKTTPNYAGDFVAAESGSYHWVILLTGDASPDQKALIARFPYPRLVETRIAQFDLATLSRIVSTIRDERAELQAAGVRLVSVGVDVPANRVAVGVAADATGASRALAQRYPIDMLKVSVVARPVPI